MANTYIPISTTTVGSGGASDVTFSSIPGTYTDLMVLGSVRNSINTDNGVYIQFNGDTGNNYSRRLLYGDGSNAASTTTNNDSRLLALTGVYSGNTANTFSNGRCYIFNYTSSSAKSIASDSVIENNATLSYINLTANIWTGTSAITSIKLFPSSGTFVQYSTFTLYGIKNS